MRSERSRAGSGAIRRTPCQSLDPLMRMPAGSENAARRASPLNMPLKTSMVRATGRLCDERPCI